jgi:flagellar biosynthetic protein FlhB
MADGAEKDPASRTEEPTPKRREEATADGQTPRSVEVTSTAVLLAALAALSQSGESAVRSMRTMMRESLLGVSRADLTLADVSDIVDGIGAAGFTVVAPILAATVVVALGSSVAQVGLRVLPKKLLPDPSKVSPAKGLERIFSRRGLVELVKSLVKIALVAWISWSLIHAVRDEVGALVASHPREILLIIGGELRRLVAWALAPLGILATLDYGFQRWEHNQSLRMTRAEVKDERRQAEGDPQIRQRVKSAYREFAKGRSLADVPTADVIVTNPVHVAVALRYAAHEMGAPRVVAKGAEHMAERIKQIARRHGVPIVERRALARALFRTVPIGKEVPATLYRAVAEILAFVYGLRATRRAS